jgi:hypothetical protein
MILNKFQRNFNVRKLGVIADPFRVFMTEYFSIGNTRLEIQKTTSVIFSEYTQERRDLILIYFPTFNLVFNRIQKGDEVMRRIKC